MLILRDTYRLLEPTQDLLTARAIIEKLKPPEDDLPAMGEYGDWRMICEQAEAEADSLRSKYEHDLNDQSEALRKWRKQHPRRKP